jgi:hypothetical protein
LRHLQQLALCYVLHAARQYYLLHCNDQPRMRYTVLYSTTTNTLYTATCAYQHHYCNYYCITQQDVNFDLWSNLKHALPHLLIYALSTAAAVKCCVELAAHYGRVTLSYAPTATVATNGFALLWTVFLWCMLAQPPRMLWYGWRRARKENKRGRVTANMNSSNKNSSDDDVEGDVAGLNNRVPALQELLNTPLSTFPPMQGELWAKLSVNSDAPPAIITVNNDSIGSNGDAACSTSSDAAAGTTAAVAASAISSAGSAMVAAVDAARAANDRCAVETVTAAPRA